MSTPPSLFTGTAPSAIADLSPRARAELIYSTARNEMLGRLWSAALGGVDAGARPGADPLGGGNAGVELDLATLLLTQTIGQPTAAPRAPVDVAPAVNDFAAAAASPAQRPISRSNADFMPLVNEAAVRTRLPASTLTGIIGAEAQSIDGRWNTASRNPRSSAAGLTQFLSGTWVSEAERPGTYLNAVAHNRGWIGDSGRVSTAHRKALLDLRFNARASIEAAADYARANLDLLGAKGLIRPNASDVEIGRAAYLAHHLGPADAVRFLSGGLDGKRAEVLLAAQIGRGAAAQHITRTGSAVEAHRNWLNGYVARKIGTA